MSILLSKRKSIYLGLVLLMMLISSGLIYALNQNDTRLLKIAILIQFTGFIFTFLLLGYINKSLVTLYSVFLSVFYLFQNGQLLLYSFGIDVNYFYVEKFSVTLLHQSVLFSNLCMFAAFAAAIFMFDEGSGRITQKINRLTSRFIYDAAHMGWCFSAVVACLLMIIKFAVWLKGGYSSIIVLERSIPSILGAVEALFPAFCILTIISGVKSNLKVKYIVILFALWGILTALIGDRTTGIGVVVLIFLMYYYGFFSFSKVKNKFIFLAGITAVLFLIVFAASFRNHDQFSLNSIFAVITNVIYELGFSFFPLAAIMNMCPTTYDFLYGESMISSVVTGFFPESLDLLGVFSEVADSASIPTYWIAARYRYGFGMDCSLNAEVYANFGMYGFMAMFIICAFVAKALKQVDYVSNQNVFSQYIGFALLFGWFTLPRRRSYYIYNKIFWYVIIVGAFIGLMYYINEKRGHHGRAKE